MTGISRVVFLVVAFLGCLLSNDAKCSDLSRVHHDVQQYDEKIESMVTQFNKVPADPANKRWISFKILHMAALDEYFTTFAGNSVGSRNYSEDEQAEFDRLMQSRWDHLMSDNSRDLKDLLKSIKWFTISEYGADADLAAVKMVMYQEVDLEFQANVVNVLATLWRAGETDPKSYAYLADTVAYAYAKPSMRKPQLYGTRGQCLGSKWEPYPVFEPENLDARRKEVGMEPEAEFIEYASLGCTLFP